MLNRTTSIGEIFCQHFDIIIAKDPSMLDRLYRLRYQIICEEFGHISPETYPDKKESDVYDQQAIHCAVIHKKTGRLAGSVRCVIPRTVPYADLSLPFEHICKDNLLGKFHMQLPQRETMIEVSRVNVAEYFRRNRSGSKLSPLEIQLSRQISSILGLCAYVINKHQGRPDSYAVMEPPLAHKYASLGIECTPQSEIFDFYGKRQLFYLNGHTFEQNLKPSLHCLLKQVEQELYPQLALL